MNGSLRGWLRLTGLALALACLLLLTAALSVELATVPAFAAVSGGAHASDALLLDRHGQPLQRLRIDNQRRQVDWTPLAEISPALIRAVVRAEDQRFMQHPGIDPLALGAVLRETLGGGRLRGASTITMQLASLLAAPSGPLHARSFGSKLAQMRDALALERHWSKSQILEAYLNLVPLRGDLAGIAASAQGLLGKGPSGLDDADAAVLAALIRAPSARPAALAQRACRLLKETGQTDRCLEAEAVAGALPRSPLLIRGAEEAPHLARQLLHTAGARVRTTLDAGLQRYAIEALRNRLAELDHRNVADGALVVLDNASGSILAYVGSSAELSSATEVDGVQALRQPGSTLKPFLYALALDRGWLHAASVLEDAPFSLSTPSGLYAPQDYEHDYKGPVSLRTALASSLNTPAVRTLDLVGVPPFLDTLHALGLASLHRDARDYGVGLALGDGEATLLELTNAYRALANRGRWSAVRVLADSPAQDASRRVFSPATAFVVADILADRSARAPTFGFDSPLAIGMWAPVKTGTSKGMRDNWAIGFTDRYTVGVWVGNFSGAPMWDVSGVSGAAPLWRDLVEWLHRADPSRAPAAPAGLRSVEVRFSPPVEPPHQEWVVSGAANGSARAVQVELKPSAASPRFRAPADQAILAPDPDIPPLQQQILVDAQGPRGACLRFDGVALARCGVLRTLLPLPRPGPHELVLTDAKGAELARCRFDVRGLPRAPQPPRGGRG